MTSRMNLLAACLVSLPLASALAAGPDGLLVKGTTTPADVENAIGMPIALTVARDGALTLVYPASRFADGVLGVSPVVTLAASGIEAPRRVRLRFARDLTYDGYTVSGGTGSINMGLASR